MSELDALRARAVELGVETSYWDVEGHYHEAPESTLRDRRRRPRGRSPRRRAPGTWSRSSSVGPARVDVGPLTDVELALADGTVIELRTRHGGPSTCRPTSRSAATSCAARPAAGEETATLVVAPSTMPRSDALAGGAGLFVPTYALWETVVAAAVVRPPGRARRQARRTSASTSCRRCRCTPPSSTSRSTPARTRRSAALHWNEVYLDDAAAAGGADARRSSELIDWQALARRRRRQLLAAASDLDPYIQAGVDRFVAARPDVVDYARFRAGAPEPADAGHPAALIERSHLLAQYLANRQLSAVEGPGRRRAGARPADRQPPRRLRDVGLPASCSPTG